MDYTYITLKIEYGVLKIFFGTSLHLYLNKDKLLGIQSWIYDEKFVIEFTLEGGAITTEYNEKGKWEHILNLLNINL